MACARSRVGARPRSTRRMSIRFFTDSLLPGCWRGVPHRQLCKADERQCVQASGVLVSGFSMLLSTPLLKTSTGQTRVAQKDCKALAGCCHAPARQRRIVSSAKRSTGDGGCTSKGARLGQRNATPPWMQQLRCRMEESPWTEGAARLCESSSPVFPHMC